MNMTFEDFKYYMVDQCGMPETEDGAVICCECGEPIYPEDFPGHDWRYCPVCEFDLLED